MQLVAARGSVPPEIHSGRTVRHCDIWRQTSLHRGRVILAMDMLRPPFLWSSRRAGWMIGNLARRNEQS
jgi:hypothetical protein